MYFNFCIEFTWYLRNNCNWYSPYLWIPISPQDYHSSADDSLAIMLNLENGPSSTPLRSNEFPLLLLLYHDNGIIGRPVQNTKLFSVRIPVTILAPSRPSVIRDEDATITRKLFPGSSAHQSRLFPWPVNINGKWNQGEHRGLYSKSGEC